MRQQDIRVAIDEEKDVVYDGLVYKITAYIYRRITNPYNGNRNSIIQVELYRGNNSVIIADPRKVELKEN